MDNSHQQLIENYLAGSSTEAEKELILQLINDNEEFSAELKEAVEIKSLIYSASNEEPLVIEVMDKITSANDLLENKVMKRIKKEKSFPVAAFIKFAAAAAIIVFILNLSLNKVKEVAILEKSQDTSIIRDNKENKDFSKLYVNDVIKTGSSRQQVTFDDGTNLNIQGKSELKVISQNPKVFNLNKGALSAEVKPQQKPMKINTPSAIIEVLGTKFTLSSQEKSSLLKVARGKVAITDKKTGEKVIVSTGTYTIAEGKELEVKSGSGPLFVSDTIDSTSDKKYVDIEVDLQGAQKIYLIAQNVSGSNEFNYSAWISPLIHANGQWMSLTKIDPSLKKAGGPHEVMIYQNEVAPDQLTVGGKNYSRGIYAHASSVIVWELPVNSTIFKCRAAIMDKSENKGAVKFLVFTEISEKQLSEYLKN